MPIQNVNREKIRAVQTYLEELFPNAELRTFAELYKDWQTYRVDFDVGENYRFSVTFAFFNDTPTDDIQTKLRDYRLAEQLRVAGQKPLLVTTSGIIIRAEE